MDGTLLFSDVPAKKASMGGLDYSIVGSGNNPNALEASVIFHGQLIHLGTFTDMDSAIAFCQSHFTNQPDPDNP